MARSRQGVFACEYTGIHCCVFICTFGLLTACGAPPHDPASGPHDLSASEGNIGHGIHDPDVAHAATGIVESVDRDAGTAVIHHDPVVSIGMPEMTMTFRLADPAMADRLQQGERISFEFVVDNGVHVTAVH